MNERMNPYDVDGKRLRRNGFLSHAQKMCVLRVPISKQASREHTVHIHRSVVSLSYTSIGPAFFVHAEALERAQAYYWMAISFDSAVDWEHLSIDRCCQATLLGISYHIISYHSIGIGNTSRMDNSNKKINWRRSSYRRGPNQQGRGRERDYMHTVCIRLYLLSQRRHSIYLEQNLVRLRLRLRLLRLRLLRPRRPLEMLLRCLLYTSFG